jgi:VanZ family protein
LKQILLAFLPPFLFLVVSIILLTLPGNDLPATGFFAQIPQFDKLVHIGMFGLLVYLFGVAIQKTLKKDRSFMLLVVATGIFYGIVMEFVQKYWAAQRSFDLADIAADTIGCIAGYALLVIRFRKTWAAQKA